MTSIETAAAYATSPERLADNQWKAAPSPAPMSNIAAVVLQTLRDTGQYMGIFAIIQHTGVGTPGEIKRALRELEDRGLLEEAPKRDKGKDEDPAQEAQEPAQEPSTPAPAPEATEPAAEPQEGAQGRELLDRLAEGEQLIEQGAIVEKDQPAEQPAPEEPILIEDTPAMPPYFEVIQTTEWQLQTGTYSEEEGFIVHEHGVYATEEEAALTGQQYLAMGEIGELAARVRQANPAAEQYGPWIAIRHPEAPSVNDDALASR